MMLILLFYMIKEQLRHSARRFFLCQKKDNNEMGFQLYEPFL